MKSIWIVRNTMYRKFYKCFCAFVKEKGVADSPQLLFFYVAM